MKKNILVSSLFLLIFVLGCKKGPDDPFLSLRTRKARLNGSWHLESGTMTLSHKSPTQTFLDENYTFTDNAYTYQEGSGWSYSGSFSLDLTFDKKGEFNFTQDIDQLHLNANGTWDFLGRIGSDKNKESINLNVSSINGGSNWLDAFNKANYNFTYKIRELRKEKLVVECTGELVSTSANDSISDYVTSKYIFVR
jgi:hypothetical protein